MYGFCDVCNSVQRYFLVCSLSPILAHSPVAYGRKDPHGLANYTNGAGDVKHDAGGNVGEVDDEGDADNPLPMKSRDLGTTS